MRTDQASRLIALLALFIALWPSAFAEEPAPPDQNWKPFVEPAATPASEIAPFALSLARYRAAVGDRLATVQATFSVENLLKERQQVPLLPAALTLTKAEVSNRKATLGRDSEGRIAVFLPEEGKTDVTVSFMTTLQSVAGRQSFHLPLPAATMVEVTVELPAQSREVTALPPVPFTVKSEKDRSLVTLYPQSTDTLMLTWTYGVAEELAPVLAADVKTDLVLSSGLLSRTDEFTCETRRGALRMLHFELADGLTLRGVTGEAVASWKRVDLDGRPGVELVLKEMVGTSFSFSVDSEQLFQMPVQLALSPLALREATQQRGTLRVRGDADISVKAADAQGLSQIDVGAVPAGSSQAAYAYEALPAALALAVSGVESRLAAAVEMLSEIEAGVITTTANVRFDVSATGMPKLAVQLDPQAQVLSVEGPELAAWRVDGGLLSLELKRVTEGAKLFRIVSQQPLERIDGIRMPIWLPQGIERFTGTLGVASGENVELLSGRVTGARQVEVATLPAWMAARRPKIGYAFERADAAIAVQSRQLVPELSADSLLLIVVEDRTIREMLRSVLSVARAPLFDLTVRVPEGAVVTDVRGGKLQEWSLKDEGRLLQLRFRQGVLGEGAEQLVILAERLTGGVPESLEFAAWECVGAKQSKQHVAIVINTNLALKETAIAGLHGIAPAELPPQFERYRTADLAYAGEETAWTLAFQPSRIEAAMNVRTGTLLSAGAGMVSARSRVLYEIRKAGVNQLRIRLPAGALDSKVTGDGIVSQQLEDDTWVITLDRKLRGSRSIDLAYDFAVPVGGEVKIAPPAVLGAVMQSGYLVVGQGLLDAEVSIVGKDMLWAAQFGELPPELKPSTEAVLSVLRYTDPKAALTLNVTTLPLAKVLQARVVSSTVQTILKPDGEAINYLNCVVANSGKQFLTVRLPEGGVLWGAYVDGEPVRTTVAEAGEVQVPILAADRRPAVRVSMIWEQSAPALGLTSALDFHTPQFDANTQRLRWQLFVPESYGLKLKGGNMQLLQSPSDVERVSWFGKLFGPELSAVRPAVHAIGRWLAAAWRAVAKMLAVLWRMIDVILIAGAGVMIAAICGWRLWRVWLRDKLGQDWPNALAYVAFALLGLDLACAALHRPLRLPFDNDWLVLAGIVCGLMLLVALVGWLHVKGALARRVRSPWLRYALEAVAAAAIIAVIVGFLLPSVQLARRKATFRARKTIR